MNRLVEITCGECGVVFAMTEETLRHYKQTERLFHCPHGHKRYFPRGETPEDALRRERDQLKQRLAQKDDEIKRHRDQKETAKRSAAAFKGQVTKLKNRAAAGVCPCCNRTFQNLKRHMESQHPTWDPVQETDNVIELVKKA